MRIRSAMIPLLAAAAGPAFGHHSLYGLYAADDSTTMQGVVIEFRFVNPHPVLVIEVATDDGARASWALEMDNRRELVDIGLAAETLKPGDRVLVRGSVGLARANTLYLRRLDRPADGFWYEQRGSTPFIGTSRVVTN